MYLSSILTNSPRHSRSNDCFYIINDLNYHLNNGEYHLVGGKAHDHVYVYAYSPEAVQRENGSSAVDVNNGGDIESQRPALSRKRPVVGILVLQFGIMIHSLVIGLITSGSEFTTLVTAIIFHQLFKGLSLGIRIATLPPKSAESDSLSSRPSSPSSSRNGKGSWVSSFTITTCVDDLIRHHNAARYCNRHAGIFFDGKMQVVHPSIPLFNLANILTSLTASEARMLLTQGLMSSISAGLLIYSATVEMIAGDFVFGNLGGHGTGTHGSGLSHADAEEGVSPKRRILAVGSLLAGVLAMGMIGLGELRGYFLPCTKHEGSIRASDTQASQGMESDNDDIVFVSKPKYRGREQQLEAELVEATQKASVRAGSPITAASSHRHPSPSTSPPSNDIEELTDSGGQISRTTRQVSIGAAHELEVESEVNTAASSVENSSRAGGSAAASRSTGRYSNFTDLDLLLSRLESNDERDGLDYDVRPSGGR
ncbi:hypothetical protein BT96DRAFT_1099069 [Gymnopus androsaceus JB14]|uniref:Zinc/iron permease n=1 Tax=Gymnopus androsaceus JB14 TaxID=1447944 RepID=A0A6A4GFV0_9AGAR|nr:hypothetical protein BT96DRAFT_1099069 [Gymnopus androsaceus JB14]